MNPEISATQVSRIAKLLDQELEQFRQRKLGQYPVVYLDAHYEKVRVQGTVQDLGCMTPMPVDATVSRSQIGVPPAIIWATASATSAEMMPRSMLNWTATFFSISTGRRSSIVFSTCRLAVGRSIS